MINIIGNIILSATSAAASVVSRVVLDGLKMWLPFERSEIVSSNQVVLDKSGNSNNATLYSGKALSFDGVNDYVDFGSDVNSNGSVWTTAIWISNYTRGSFDWIYGDDSTRNIGLNRGGALDGNVFYRESSGTYNDFSCDVFKSDFSEAKRLVFTSDGTDINLYIDGQFIDSITPTATNLKISRLMAGFNTTQYLVDADVSDFQIYNTAWTQADVTFDYNYPQHLVTYRSGTSVTLSNLKGYWHLSEGAGGICYDSSGEEGNNGTINGATHLTAQSTIPQLGLMDWAKSTVGSDEITLISDPNNPSQDILGNAVRLREHSFNLDGTGYAEVADDDSLDFGTGDFSVECWVKYSYVNQGSSLNAIYTSGGQFNTTNNFSIVSSNLNTLRFLVNGTSSESTTTFTQGEWVHIVGTRESGSNGVKLYINGNKTPEDTATNSNSVTNALTKKIGQDTHPSRYYNDLIDEVRLYSRALTPDEVEQNYNAGIDAHRVGSSFSDDFSSDYGN